MQKEIIGTGKTVEEAIDSACEKLGCSREETEWEILDLPKKSFLGLKTAPARVKVWIPVKEESHISLSTPKQPAAPKAPEKRPERAVEAFKKTTEMPPLREKEPERVATPAAPVAVLSLTGETAAKAEAARAYLEAVCRDMGVEGTFTVHCETDGICIEMEGQNLGAIIGRRGETLDALQYLAGLVANRMEGDYLRVTVDCGDYRTKRKATLEALAKKLSAQVLKTNARKMLEPMNPFERRIIHATVSEIEGVTSTSVGEEPNRRVVITVPGARRPRDRVQTDAPQPPRELSAGVPRGDRSDRSDRRPPPRRDGGGVRRGGRDNRGGRESTMGGTINTLPQAPLPLAEPKKTPESTSDKPLYAKLDLE